MKAPNYLAFLHNDKNEFRVIQETFIIQFFRRFPILSWGRFMLIFTPENFLIWTRNMHKGVSVLSIIV